MNYRYTLRNAEYRLCLEKTLDMCERDLEKPKAESAKFDLQDFLRDSVNAIDFGRKNNLSPKVEKSHEDFDIQDLGQISAEAQEYISNLESRLSSMKKVNCRIEDPPLNFEKILCIGFMVH
jgi:hypothetical protein